MGVSEADGTLLLAPMITVATTVPVPEHIVLANLVYVTVPVTPVDGNPPVNVADMVVDWPTIIELRETEVVTVTA